MDINMATDTGMGINMATDTGMGTDIDTVMAITGTDIGMDMGMGMAGVGGTVAIGAMA
jgi:hypothetical protein